MPQYAVGHFSWKDEYPRRFVSRGSQPFGPVSLNTKRTHSIRPDPWQLYLFEVEGRKSFKMHFWCATRNVMRIIAPLSRIQGVFLEALHKATWEAATEHGCQWIQVVGKTLETEYGCFRPWYDNGKRSEGRDESPRIVCSVPEESIYADALRTRLAQDCLFCFDPIELGRAERTSMV